VVWRGNDRPSNPGALAALATGSGGAAAMKEAI
jgi:hypothetical protein